MKKLIVLLFILVIILNPVYSQEKTFTYNTDINLNLLDINYTVDKIYLEVYDYLTEELFFVKEIFPEKKEIYSFSKVYPEKLLFRYKIYYLENIDIDNYIINLLENENNFNILLCQKPIIDNCVEKNIFYLNEEIYLVSTKNEINYNVIVIDDLGNELLRQNSINLPLNLSSLNEGSYIVKIENNGITKKKYFKKINTLLKTDQNNPGFKETDNEDVFKETDNEDVFQENENRYIFQENDSDKKENKSFLIYFILFIILILLVIISNKKKKKTFLFILSIILITGMVFGSTSEYSQLEISYQTIEEIIEQREENTFIIRENSNNEYILPLLQLNEIIPEDEEIVFYINPETENVKINIIPFYVLLMGSQEKQKEFEKQYPNTYNRCQDIFSYYKNNPILSQQDLLNRSYDNFYENEKFNSDCVLDLVEKKILVEKIIFYKIKFKPVKEFQEIISFDLFFDIKHIYWNPESRVTRINLVKNNLKDIYFYPTLEKISIYKDLRNNNFNMKNESINNNIFINSYNLKDRELILEKIEKENYSFSINNRKFYFSKNNNLFFDIIDTNYTYQINGIAQLNHLNNSFYLNYYLFENTIFKDNKITTKRNRIRIKNDLINHLFFRDGKDIFLERSEKIHDLSDNLRAHYSFNQDKLCVFLFQLAENETNYYYNCKNYDSIIYSINLKDLNVTSISKNELGTKVIIDNNTQISNHFYYPEIQIPEIYFPDKNYFYYLDKELIIKQYYFSNNNVYQPISQNKTFREVLLEKQKYFYDENNFETVKNDLITILDVANTFRIDKKQINYFAAYLLTILKNDSSEIYSQMCSSEYTQYQDILENTNFKYLKYNFNNLPDEEKELIVDLDFNKNKEKDYFLLCESLILSKEPEISNFSKSILIATKYLSDKETKKESINDYYLFLDRKNKFVFKNPNYFYIFLTNYIFLEHIYNNLKHPINDDIKQIYKHAFLDFKIPNMSKDALEIKEDIEKEFLEKSKYIGNCSLLSVDSLNLIFDYPVKYNLADAWYLVGNKNESIWQIDKDGPLNKKHLFPGIILGIYTGSNIYQYTNFISPYHYDIPQHYIDQGFYTYDSEKKLTVPYTHVVSYLGNFEGKKDVILNAGSTGAEILTLDQYVPRGETEGNWIRRSIVEILVPYNYYTEEEIKNIKKYLTDFN